MLCPNCDVELDNSVNFCPNCGTNVIPMKNVPPYEPANAQADTAQAYAPQAQPVYTTQGQAAYATQDDKSAFERGYQQGYEWATSSAAAQQTAEQAAAANAYQQAQQQYYAPPASPYAQAGSAAYAKKSKVAAGLLAIFLGALGVHKFYLGYNKQGVIMLLVTLLTFGLGGCVTEIIAIIEGIMYLVKTDDEFYRMYELGDKPWF